MFWIGFAAGFVSAFILIVGLACLLGSTVDDAFVRRTGPDSGG